MNSFLNGFYGAEKHVPNVVVGVGWGQLRRRVLRIVGGGSASSGGVGS